LDEGREIEREGEQDLYLLSIYLVHTIEPDLVAAAAAAQAVKAQIDDLFERRCKKNGQWVGIQLEGCYVYSMTEITLDVADKLKRWNTDYLSLRTQPQSPMIQA
jgi:hypothetical protein